MAVNLHRRGVKIQQFLSHSLSLSKSFSILCQTEKLNHSHSNVGIRFEVHVINSRTGTVYKTRIGARNLEHICVFFRYQSQLTVIKCVLFRYIIEFLLFCKNDELCNISAPLGYDYNKIT